MHTLPAGTPQALAVAMALLAVAASGCLNSATVPDDVDPATADAATGANATVVRFIAIGDVGTGDANQYRVADAMASVCESRGCDFAVTLGDNIYETGVTSPYDPQFETKFEVPYAAVDFPFYLSLGNHDNVQGDVHAAGDFQVAYSERTDRSSDKWHMPSRWYDHRQGPVQFLALDTNIIFDGLFAAPSADPNGAAQGAWFDAMVAATWAAGPDAPWVIAYGHHPIYSNGVHGDAFIEDPDRAAWLTDRLCTGAIDLMIGGHDHDLQWLAPHEECPGVEVIVSGAGGQTRSLEEGPNQAYFAVGDTLGFWWLEATDAAITGVAYDDAGTPLFEHTTFKADLRAARTT